MGKLADIVIHRQLCIAMNDVLNNVASDTVAV
jgi:hypothetical protein